MKVKDKVVVVVGAAVEEDAGDKGRGITSLPFNSDVMPNGTPEEYREVPSVCGAERTYGDTRATEKGTVAREVEGGEVHSALVSLCTVAGECTVPNTHVSLWE